MKPTFQEFLTISLQYDSDHSGWEPNMHQLYDSLTRDEWTPVSEGLPQAIADTGDFDEVCDGDRLSGS